MNTGAEQVVIRDISARERNRTLEFFDKGDRCHEQFLQT
jgi:hypothetical protein